ncbi:hypothetical protein N9393_05540 [Luminiphilus sp.]|nr:hypothetical protein [Luminiphilus sp.]
MLVKFRNDMGINRQVKVGFSWTSFFFGGFPFLFRGMPLHGLGWIFLAIITFGISNLILSFIINKQTAVYYLENGYKPEGPNWDVAASKWDVSLPEDIKTEPTSLTEGSDPQAAISESVAASKVGATPLPLILVGVFALLQALTTQLMIGGYIGYEFMSMISAPIAVINIGVFVWAVNEYLDKTEHKAIAISLMLVATLVNFVWPILDFI